MAIKKIGIISLYGNNNFGNKLQQYAVENLVKKFVTKVNIIKEIDICRKERKCINSKILNCFRSIKRKILKPKYYRNINFYKFEKNFLITDYKNYYSNNKNSKLNKKYDYFILGSDQVWNPDFGLKGNFKYLDFSNRNKNIAFSASFGVSKIPDDLIEEYKKGLQNFKAISVREDRGKEIVEELTGRKDVEVLVDPTMLLTADEWDKISKKPEQLKTDRYILNYFLGELSKERKEGIERIAKENNCEIINLLDKNDPLYVSGPSEFLYLEKHAFLICTDSFHSSVFAILYNRPFIVFDREQENIEDMSSRIDTLINKFKLKNRKFTGKIEKENLEHDYTEAYRILEFEREKSDKFLRKALDIE